MTQADTGSGDAAAAALAAIVARRASVERACNHREARRNANDVELVAGLLDHQFGATRFGRRQKDAVGGAGNIFFRSENADVRLHLVVIRCEIFVSDGPVVPESIARCGLEIDGSKAECDAAPMIGAAADDARPKPLETGAGSGSVRLALDIPCPVRIQKLAEILARLPPPPPPPTRPSHRPL